MRLSLRSSLPLALLGVLAVAVPASAEGTSATSLGDELFPQIGNGGYDVGNYDIALDYDPSDNSFGAGTRTTITATATMPLSVVSFDFQRELDISAVTVDGAAATFERRDAIPRFSTNPAVTQPAKLFVRPGAEIPKGSEFVVEVAYTGVPQEITDADESIEGWVRACSSPGNCDGAITVNEPIGAQSWFPCNDYMTDKASVTTSITVPDPYTALGTGELSSKVPGPGATTTWNWTEDDPTATYLTSATVGRFDFDANETVVDHRGGATLPIYEAIDSAGSAAAKAGVARAARRIPSMLNFLSKRLGPYPFDSIGYVADWVPSVGYALENQTKPHFAGDGRGPSISDGELLHEIAHQWMGDSVSARTWQQIWFNEGWATFLEVYWGSLENDAKQTPQQFFKATLASKPKAFELAPAHLESPANLFSGFAVYSRPGAMLEGYREIVGNKRFFALATKTAQGPHSYGTISETAFVHDAMRGSGFRGARLHRLGRYFRQWLHREGKPTLTPADFPSG